VLEKKRIQSSRDAYELLQTYISDMNYEQFMVVFLNRSNQVLRVATISDGGISGTVVDPKRVFKLAFEANATSIILGHNHPSGNVAPSQQDIKLTEKLKSGASYLDIAILDHVIVGDEKYFSFADEGKI
jgi:DNA repair protein RadC